MGLDDVVADNSVSNSCNFDFVDKLRGAVATTNGNGIEPRYARFVITEDSWFRKIWTVLIAVLLIYTGTVFVWYLAFVEFRIDFDGTTDKYAQQNPFMKFDDVVYWIFVADLFLGFFFSYRDADNVEIVDLPRCVKYYLKASFLINVVACFPSQLVDHESKVQQSVRVLRMQRMTRLLRLLKVRRGLWGRQGQMADWAAWIEQFKAIRVVNLGIGLLWIVHVLACGWYLCAALHKDPSVTWVVRREVGAGDDVTPLHASKPLDCWMQAMYFVITVFTTVGFGDMSALTNGEIAYVTFLMIVGVVVHSVIIGEVIGVVTASDRVHDFVNSRKDLVDAFANHTELDEDTGAELSSWIYSNARFWMKQQYPKEDMKQLIIGKYMPRDLMAIVPKKLFGGALYHNRFLTCASGLAMPPRLPMLLALHLARSEFCRGDVIFENGDYPFNFYLVTKGVFAFTRRQKRQPDGTILKVVDHHDELAPCAIFPFGTYFGDFEIFKGCARKYSCECATEHGQALVIQRSEFQELAQDFPEFAKTWLRSSRQKDLRITDAAQEASHVPFLDFAVRILQRFVRERARIRKERQQSNKATSHMMTTGSLVVRAENNEDSLTAGRGISSKGRDTKNAVLEARVATVETKLSQILELLRQR